MRLFFRRSIFILVEWKLRSRDRLLLYNIKYLFLNNNDIRAAGCQPNHWAAQSTLVLTILLREWRALVHWTVNDREEYCYSAGNGVIPSHPNSAHKFATAISEFQSTCNKNEIFQMLPLSLSPLGTCFSPWHWPQINFSGKLIWLAQIWTGPHCEFNSIFQEPPKINLFCSDVMECVEWSRIKFH